MGDFNSFRTSSRSLPPSELNRTPLGQSQHGAQSTPFSSFSRGSEASSIAPFTPFTPQGVDRQGRQEPMATPSNFPAASPSQPLRVWETPGGSAIHGGVAASSSEVAAPAASVSDEQFDAAKEWLLQLYGNRQIPPFEVNPTTKRALFMLMQRAKVRSAQADLLLEDANHRAAELAHEARRHRQTLAALGLHPTQSLSSDGQQCLDALASSGEKLGLKNGRMSSFYTALADLQTKVADMRVEERETQASSEKLRELTRKALADLGDVSKIRETARSQRKTMRQPVQMYLEQTATFKAKRRDYKNRLAKQKVALESTKVQRDLTHSALLHLAKQREDLLEKANPMIARVKAYHDLPPDMTLARIKIDQKRAELAQLEEAVTERLSRMNLYQ